MKMIKYFWFNKFLFFLAPAFTFFLSVEIVPGFYVETFRLHRMKKGRGENKKKVFRF